MSRRDPVVVRVNLISCPFARGENVVPAISYLKEGELFGVTDVEGKVEEALRVIERLEPDALNLVLMPTDPISFSESGGAPSVPKQVLFAMTFDHLGSRWLSLFEVRREKDSIELKDVTPENLGLQKVSIHTTPEGDLNIMLDSMPTRS